MWGRGFRSFPGAAGGTRSLELMMLSTEMKLSSAWGSTAAPGLEAVAWSCASSVANRGFPSDGGGWTRVDRGEAG
jgi:hypothetical protein